MLDKSAITEAAQKFAAKGQIDKAIAEWEKLLKESQDGNIYNVVGDLYLKKGAEREAIEAFKKAADIFRRDGFYLKAMALYKKILNISASEVEALISLAELNAEKNLIGAANDYFRAAAEKCIRGGATEKALDLYKKMLKLNPSDIELKLKVVELYLKIGLKMQAVKEYLSIASMYLENREHEKAQEFYNKVIALDTQNVASFIGLSRIAEDADNIAEAYEYLNKALSFAKDNNELLFNYSRLAIKTDNMDDAKLALTKLVEIDPSNNHYKKLLGSIYLKEGLLEKALEESLPYIDELLYVRDESLTERWSEALELLNNFKEIAPVAVKSRLIIIYKKMHDKEALIRELGELARVFDGKGLLKDALKSYKELLELNPSDEAVKGRIKDLEGSVKDILSETEVLTQETAVPSAKLSRERFDEKLAEADFYAQQGLKDEAIGLYEELLSASPENDELIKKLESLKPEIPVRPKPEESYQSSKDSKEGAIEADVSKVKIVRSEEDISTSAADGDLIGVFHKFKEGVDEKLGEKDYETRYNLGIAYKEMGLLEDAIKEFQIVAKDPERAVQSSHMLALCYMDKKLYPLAIKEFKKVIEAMAPADEGYLGVKFDLAEAYAENNEYDNALKLYIEVYEQDSNFRDVKFKFEKIKALVSEETKDKSKSKKDRISYL